ncbi:hypothetical protein NE237_029306 [Protea cynaroides]|uniref:Uncharacterized protein n=1 Tax=Protea cynaroides TaxID=273540 RepID=A0A9Q0JTS1_9MAGN|nr:hypothetical protein NE237_029306 [Protea cynaroides]
MAYPPGEQHEHKEINIASLPSTRIYPKNSPIHKVGRPPKQKLLDEFTGIVKESFFSDDPLREFKDQTGSRKIILDLQSIFPILKWGRDYNLTKFRGNFIAGLTIASLWFVKYIQRTHQWNWQTKLIGASFLVVLLFAKYIVRVSILVPLFTWISEVKDLVLILTWFDGEHGKKNKKLFWVPAIAPLIFVIVPLNFNAKPTISAN